MRLATIDIGTNTILLLITERSPEGRLLVLHDAQVIARLGKGVDEHRLINAETFQRALTYLKQYKKIVESFGAPTIIARGTSALRDAVNKEEFTTFIRERTGIAIEVLSGQDEAQLTYSGAVSEFLGPNDRTPCAVLDIGGGSTELTRGTAFEAGESISLDLGSVRLTERVLKSSPPSEDAIQRATKEIHTLAASIPPLPPRARLFGVAGTVTTLAAIDLGLRDADSHRVSGHVLTRGVIEKILSDISSLSTDAMMSRYPQIQAGRADIILAGILILRETLKSLGQEGITVSARGLRFGIALAAHADMQANI